MLFWSADDGFLPELCNGTDQCFLQMIFQEMEAGSFFIQFLWIDIFYYTRWSYFKDLFVSMYCVCMLHVLVWKDWHLDYTDVTPPPLNTIW